MTKLLFVIAAFVLSLSAFANEGGLLDQNAGIVAADGPPASHQYNHRHGPPQNNTLSVRYRGEIRGCFQNSLMAASGSDPAVSA